MEGIVFFMLWVFACIACTGYGWKIPVVRDALVLYVTKTERSYIQWDTFTH